MAYFNAISTLPKIVQRYRPENTTLQDMTSKVAVVTGGAQGVGKTIARVLLKRGCKVSFQWRIQDVQEGGVNLEEGANLLFGQIFLKTA